MKAWTTGIAILFLFVVAGSLSGAEVVKVKYTASLYTDVKGDPLRLPQGVGCSATVLFVADTGNNRIIRYSLESGSVRGGDALVVPELSTPLVVQVNSKGEILVLDGRKLRIERLSPAGAFLGYVDPAGTPPGSVVPRSFRVDSSDSIHVLDVFGERVLILDPSGNFQRQIAFPGGAGFISDLAVDSRGTVYLLDSVNAMIYRAPKDGQGFTPLTGRLEEHVKFPANLAVDGGGTVFVADSHGSILAMFGQNGSFLGHSGAFGWKEGLFRYPAQVCVNDRGDLFVADKSNSRVQVFSVIK